jgi:hypothetical protein
VKIHTRVSNYSEMKDGDDDEDQCRWFQDLSSEDILFPSMSSPSICLLEFVVF